MAWSVSLHRPGRRRNGRGAKPAYSYRDDSAVPPFPDDRPLIVFDGECVLCSQSARFVLRADRRGRFRIAAAQSPLGRALYAHYGLNAEAYETNLLVAEGRGWFKSDAVLGVISGLGPPWSVLALARLAPHGLRDGLYDLLARRRFQLFGRRACLAPTPEQRGRFLA